MAKLPGLPSGSSFNPGGSKLRGAGRQLGSPPTWNAKIEFKGLDELARNMAIGSQLPKLIQPVMEEVAQQVRDDVAREAPEKTGALSDSFEVEMHREGIGFDIISKKVYHGVVNWGWKAKGIRAARYSRRPVRKAFGASNKKRVEERLSKWIGRS